MKIVIVDVEATCWEDKRPREESEIISIGAIRNIPFDIEPTFYREICPDGEISEFCHKLTGFSQKTGYDEKFKESFTYKFGATYIQALNRYDNSFVTAIREFIEWLDNPEEYLFCTWGNYDRWMLEMECQRNKIKYPFINHFNIKEWVKYVQKHKKHHGVNAVLEKLGMKFIGTEHNALDDAINEARIMQHLNFMNG